MKTVALLFSCVVILTDGKNLNEMLVPAIFPGVLPKELKTF